MTKANPGPQSKHVINTRAHSGGVNKPVGPTWSVSNGGKAMIRIIQSEFLNHVDKNNE